MASTSVLSKVGPVSTGPVVSVRGLVRIFTLGGVQVPALRGVDLEVTAGEIVVLMGPSGCGKTTLLHLLAGLDTPDDGELVVAGVDPRRADQVALARALAGGPALVVADEPTGELDGATTRQASGLMTSSIQPRAAMAAGKPRVVIAHSAACRS